MAKVGDQSVVLKAVGKRFVLLRAKDPAALAIKLEASTAPPGRVAVNLRDYHTLRPLDAIGPIQGTVRRDGSTIVIEVGAR